MKKIYLSLVEKMQKYGKQIVLLFYFGIALYSFIIINQYSLIFNISGKYKSTLRIVAFIFMLPKILFTKYSKKDVIVSISMVIFALFAIFMGGDKSLLIIPIIFIGIKDIDIKKIVRIIFTINLCSLLLHFICFVINYVYINKELLSIFKYMWSDYHNNLMFTNRNLFSFRFVCLLMQYIYLTNREENRKFKILILLLFSIIMFFFSNSRTSLFMSILVIAFLLLENNKRFANKLDLIKLISIPIGVLSSAFLIVCGKYYESTIFNTINTILSRRPFFIYKIYEYMGVHLLPNLEKFESIREYFGKDTIIVPDNSYISILLKWGIIITILLLIFVYFLVINRSCDLITTYYFVVMMFVFIFEYYSPDFIIYIVPLLVIDNYFNKRIE